MRTRIAAALTTVTALLTLAACSSSSSSDAKPTPPATASGTPSAGAPAPTTQAATDASALEQSVRTYTADLFGGHADGYKLVSARCKQQMTKSAWADLATQAHHQYGSQTATGIHIDQQSGDLARVSYGAGHIPQFNRKSQPWARESGTWRWDACPSSN